MSGHQGRQNRQSRRADKRRENDKRQGKQYPDLVQSQNELDGKLEAAMNRIRFGELQPRNEAQARCIEVVENTRLAFITGPAGTGKTFLSISLACEMLEAGEIERIIITRPMVGCDEDMGFLPGTEWEKFKAWIGPALEVLEGKLGAKKVESYVAYKKIVGAPLMMMRGSTFRNSFVLLDEAQNSTKGQMQMFLTRLGEGSKVVVAGDLRQSDRAGDDNGLSDATHRFRNSRVMGRFEFDEEDITRDPLVREVVKAYRD
ncbi:PhoH-like protein [Pseudomonas phage ZY21]|nr:PhoH-like protein [Pseudomonas phage ZY21]